MSQLNYGSFEGNKDYKQTVLTNKVDLRHVSLWEERGNQNTLRKTIVVLGLYLAMLKMWTV